MSPAPGPSMTESELETRGQNLVDELVDGDSLTKLVGGLLRVAEDKHQWQHWLGECAQTFDCDQASLIRWSSEDISRVTVTSTRRENRMPAGWINAAEHLLSNSLDDGPAFLDELTTGENRTHGDQIGWPEGTSLACVIGRVPARVVLLLHRETGKEPWGQHDRDRLASLFAPLEQTIRLYKRIARSHEAMYMCMEILDTAPRAIVSLTNHGKIGFCNKKGLKIIDTNDGIYRSGGKLIVGNDKQQRRFYAHLHQICDTDDEPRSLNIRVDRPSGLPAYQLMLRELASSGETLEIMKARRLAVVYIHDPVDHGTLVIDSLRNFYGMTEAQARLATTLYAGYSVIDAAEHLGVSINTTRTHLRRMYAKLGVSTQAEFLRQLASSLKSFEDD